MQLGAEIPELRYENDINFVKANYITNKSRKSKRLLSCNLFYIVSVLLREANYCRYTSQISALKAYLDKLKVI